jgi:arylsulfatase
VTVVFEYTHEATTYGGGGTAVLSINGTKVGEAKFEHVPPVRYSATETLDIGMDLGEAVSTQYEGPNPFTGKVQRVTFEILQPERHGELEEQDRFAKRRVWASLE